MRSEQGEYIVHFLKAPGTEDLIRHKWMFIFEGKEMIVDEIVFHGGCKTQINNRTPIGTIVGMGSYTVEYIKDDAYKGIRIVIQ